MIQRLDDAFEGQRRFIQEASHELRNPLAVIRTNLDVALADPDPDPEELRRTLDVVRRTTARMSHLVDDLLVYGRLGAPAHDLGPVELAPLAAEVADEFRAPAAERSIAIETRLAPGVAPTWGDRIALRQALANLLANAVRLAPEGSTIVVAVDCEHESCRLSVSDDGPGIPLEQRERVFQRFWRGDRSSRDAGGHSGLGLAIVDQIVRDHRGSVSLTDSETGGSTFALTFPHHQPSIPREI